MDSRQFALDVVRRLRSAGHVAYWAGGCVRDQLLGLPPKDYDVATSARPEEIQALFPPRRTLAIGAAFGVITVLAPRGVEHVEVATFRRDVAYSDGRRPDAVVYTDAREDALRRDFTINGLFFDPIDEQVLDFVGGQDDLRAGVIRAIGNPIDRFDEDRLRMLRAIRIAARFDFEIEPATFEAVRHKAREVTSVSPERITQEFQRMLVDRHRVRAASLLQQSGLLEVVLPEGAALVGARWGEGTTAWDDTLAVLGKLESPRLAGLALAVLLHAMSGACHSSPEVSHGEKPHQYRAASHTVHQIGRRMRMSNHDRDRAGWLVQHQEALRGAAAKPWSEVQRMLIAPGGEELVALTAAEESVRGWGDSDLRFCREKLALPREVLDPPPLITGDDLRAHGIRQGPHFRTILEAVRDEQLLGRLATRDEALAFAERWLSK